MMATDFTSGVDFPIGSFMGQILYPFGASFSARTGAHRDCANHGGRRRTHLGISFLFPIFLVTIVKDKEERVLVMMKMVWQQRAKAHCCVQAACSHATRTRCDATQNGLSVTMYWLAEYLHFYILHIVSTIVFVAAGFIFQLQFFTLTAPGVRPVRPPYHVVQADDEQVRRLCCRMLNPGLHHHVYSVGQRPNRLGVLPECLLQQIAQRPPYVHGAIIRIGRLGAPLTAFAGRGGRGARGAGWALVTGFVLVVIAAIINIATGKHGTLNIEHRSKRAGGLSGPGRGRTGAWTAWETHKRAGRR